MRANSRLQRHAVRLRGLQPRRSPRGGTCHGSDEGDDVEMNQTLHVCRVRVPEGARDYVTVLPPETVSERGLPSVAIVGALTKPLGDDDGVAADVFTPNPAFVRFMHDVLARHTPLVDSFREEARRQREGWV